MGKRKENAERNTICSAPPSNTNVLYSHEPDLGKRGESGVLEVSSGGDADKR
jgi:hypothetical protein